MGCAQSSNVKQAKCKNLVKNAALLQKNSEQQENDKVPEDRKPFQTLMQKHRNIINLAISSAFSKLESDVPNKAQEEQKKILSSLNRYYQQNRKTINEVDCQIMNQNDYETILRTLKKHHLFRELFQLMNTEKDFLTKFLLSIHKKTFKFKDYIYRQFDPPSKFYIVAEGKLFVQLNCMGLKPISRGDYFGLQSIIYDSDQGQSIKVKSSTAILYEIQKERIDSVRKKISLKHKEQIRHLLEQKVIFFNFLDNKEKQKLLAQTVKSTYSKGEIIFEKDYDSNSYFVIKKGYVLIKIPSKKDLILEEGDSFGQSAFVEDKGQRKGKAIAYQDNTIIYAIGSRSIIKSLGNKLDCAVLPNLQKWALYRDPTINQMFFTYNFDMQKLIHKFHVKKGQKYQVLGRKGQSASKIFINLKCSINFSLELKIVNSESIKTHIQNYFKAKNQQNSHQMMLTTQQGFLHQKEQWSGKNQLCYQSDIIITEKGNYAQTSIEEVVFFIIQAIEEPEKHQKQKFKTDLSVKNLQKYIKLSQKDSSSTILAVQKNFGIEHIIKIYSKRKNCKLKNLISHKTIQTLHSKYQKSANFKDQQQNDIEKVYKYKEIIENLNYFNICGFYKAEQDQNNIYLLFQYIKGITLFEFQMELGIMPEIVVKFYILKLALILDYLHKENIVFRDLKPDNVLIDNKGYPNLFDFKTAKKLNEKQNFRTHTLIGTPHYISPEMIQKKPYTFSSDYWQLGVVLYELIYEKLPFADQHDDPMQIFTQILQKQPKLKKQNSLNVLKHLLQKNPEKRVKNFNELTKQSYFSNFECQNVRNEKMVPPYIPKSISQRFQNFQVFVRNQKF